MQNTPTALITGAARRIGAVIAARLHQAGYGVIIHANQSQAKAEQLCKHLNQLRPNSASCCFADLLDPHAPETLIEAALAWAGRLDVLVNNASCFMRTDEVTEDWDTTFHLNVRAPHALSQAARPYLKTQQGVIINLSDIHATLPLKGYAVYCQSKAALNLQTLTLAKAFAPDIRVNAVAPGAIAWPEGDNTLSAEIRQKIVESTPLKRHGSPQDIAEAVLWLAQQTFITGQILSVDGGRSIS